MKKALGQLSRSYHKENKSLEEILPQLKEIFDQIKLNHNNYHNKDVKKCLNMIVNMSVADMEFVEEILNWADNKKYITEQIYTAVIKSVCNKNKSNEDRSNKNIADRCIGLIQDMVKSGIVPHIRTFFPIYHNLSTASQYITLLNIIEQLNIVPNRELFSLMIRFTPSDIDNHMFKYIINWSAQHCNTLCNSIQSSPKLNFPCITETYEGLCQNCHSTLKIIDLSPTQRQSILEAVFEKESNPAIMRWVQNRVYDIVIDGANVAHYNNSPFDIRKVITMVDKINNKFDNPRILLIFSACRKKTTKNLIKKWDNVDVFYTRTGTNDDLSWLYVAIWYPNIWCITNDQMRDHVYYRFTKAVGRNIIDLWMERNIVPFSFDIQKQPNQKQINVQVRLDIPLCYSIRPQHDECRVHIPIEDNQWICAYYNLKK